MATMDVTRELRGGALLRDLLGALRAGWQAFRRRREERRAIAAIARLGPRLIRDLGLDPESIRAELGGGWDAVDAVGLRMLLPKGAHLREAA